MDDYLAKPIRSADLYAVVEKHGLGQTPDGRSRSDQLGAPVSYATASAFSPAEFRASIGDADLMKELIELYFEDTRQMLVEAESAFAGNDVRALHEAAHALKGLIANYAGDGAFRAVSDFCRFARDGRIDAAGRMLPELRRQIDRLGDELRNFRDSLS
jgi:HPt (histidine-containing phosphotransfer) domain-containing protein